MLQAYGDLAKLFPKIKGIQELELFFHTVATTLIFYTNDLLKGLKDMMELYIEKINQQEKAENKVTNFLFSNEILLKEKKSTYDIAVMAEKIKAMNKLHDGKEGAK